MNNSKSLKSIIQSNRPKAKPKAKSQIKKIEKDTTESESLFEIDIIENELINPCRDEILNTKLLLRPDQMDNDLYINLKKNLIEKVEGRCMSHGFVIKVYRIIEYSCGIVEPENFTGSAMYNIKYFAKICIALKESIIVARISSYLPNVNFAIADYGDIQKIIFTKSERDLNTNVFSIKNDRSIVHISTNKIIGINDFVKIQLKSIKIYQNDTIIKCMGYLYDIATQQEILSYGYDDDIKTIIQDTRINSIYFNDDNDIEEKNIEES